jgi:hypothetical protein
MEEDEWKMNPLGADGQGVVACHFLLINNE